jgi:hypothetical protein
VSAGPQAPGGSKYLRNEPLPLEIVNMYKGKNPMDVIFGQRIPRMKPEEHK